MWSVIYEARAGESKLSQRFNQQTKAMGNLQKTVQISLLLIFASATGLALARPGSATVPAAKTVTLHPILTPAASVASSVLLYGDAIPVDRQTSPNPHLWFWPVLVAGVIAFVIVGRRLRHWLLHGEYFKMQPHEVALQYLAEACRLCDPDHTREYCYEVSRIIRRYIEERFGIQKALLPTEEFLSELTVSSTALPSSHRRLLAIFLEHYQQAKSAGWYYCRLDLEVMHLNVVEFVSQAAPDSPAGSPGRATSSDGKAELPPHQRKDGPKH
jgi:hypothetical protein